MSVANILQVFILIGAAQGTLLSVAIFKRSTKRNFNWLLGLSLLTISLRLFVYPFMALSDLSIWGYICEFSLLSLLLVGPSIFLFLYQKSHTLKKIHTLHLLHLIPFLAYTLHMFLPLFAVPVDYSYATLISGVAYGLASFLLIFFPKARSYRTQLYSLSIPLFLIPSSIFSLVDLSNNYLGFHPATIPYIVLTTGLYRMGFLSMTNSTLYFKKLLEFNAHQTKNIDHQKLNLLIQSVEKQKLYLDPEISTQVLSLKTGLTRHEISEILNQGLGKTFNLFINSYRVEEAKKNLLDSNFDHLSIAGVGMESGFKSKSNFNLVFKQFTGQTPSEFKENGANYTS